MKTQFVDFTMTSAAKHTNGTTKYQGTTTKDTHDTKLNSIIYLSSPLGCVDLYHKLVVFIHFNMSLTRHKTMTRMKHVIFFIPVYPNNYEDDVSCCMSRRVYNLIFIKTGIQKITQFVFSNGDT